MAHALRLRAPHAPRSARSRPALGLRLAPTFEHVWIALALASAVLGSALFPIEPIDYWWTVKLGDLIRQHGGPLASEPLVYTPVREVGPDGQWLARVAISWLHEAGGVELTLALRTAVAFGAAGLLLVLCRDAGAGIRTSSAVVCLAGLLYLPGLSVRPQLLAVLPFLVVLRAALVPPTSVAGVLGVAAVVASWANVHGSFVLTYGLLLVGVLDAVRRLVSSAGRFDGSAQADEGGTRARLTPARLTQTRLGWSLALAVACAVAPLANPYGLGLATYVWDAVLVNSGGTAMGTLATEWGQPALGSAYGRALLVSLLGVVLLASSGRRPRFAEGVLLLVFGVLALLALRHILWWGLVMAPFAARALGDAAGDWCTRLVRMRRRADDVSDSGALLDAPDAGNPLANGAILALLALVAVACLPPFRTRLPLPPDRTALVSRATPVAVAEYLAAHPAPGALFHATDWGGYFGWRLGPARGIFIDNRFELHPEPVWRDYVLLSQGHATWERVAEGYGIGQLALQRETQPGLIRAAAESPRWARTYQDEQAVVFERVAPIAGAGEGP